MRIRDRVRRASLAGIVRLFPLILLVSAGGCAGCGSGEHGSNMVPVLRFDRETVVLRIAPGVVEVDGRYEFLSAGTGPDSVSLFYPYPRDSLLGPAETRVVEGGCDRGPVRPMPFVEHPPAGVGWRVPLSGCKRLTIHTIYRQRLETTYARYIVTTTAAWGRPLRRARFEIHLPPGTVPEQFSFPFKKDSRAGGNTWTYETTDFMPATDVVVRWRSAVAMPESRSH